MTEQAAELMANNREGLRAYGVERAAEIEAMRMRPVSEPGPSISCMGDLAAGIVADRTFPIKQERSSLRDWLVTQEETPEVSFCPPLCERREVSKISRFLRLITISKGLYRLQKSTAKSLAGGGMAEDHALARKLTW
jgi:hypothetical protein